MDDLIGAPGARLYDEVPYPELSHELSHPGHMGAVAHLLGLDPAPPEVCRVLEIGCANGYNLIPMAEALPGTLFVGIDYSAKQVAAGQAVIEALGLRNVELQYRDLTSIGESDGKFDYIIAYGLYSWIPAPVRDRLIALLRANLSENGVGYLSYDVYPGWHQMRKMREMMLFHTRRIENPLERVAAAKDFVAFLASAEPVGEGGRDSFVQAYARSLEGRADGFLLHDELAPVNDPVYFHEFASHLEEHGLAYLAEADFPEVLSLRLGEDVAKRLQSMARSLVEREQYMDFLRDRGFRQSLVSHVDNVRHRDLKVDAGRYRRFFVGSRASPVGAVDAASSEIGRFQVPGGLQLATNHPVSKAAMLVLAAVFPLTLAFDDLFTRAAGQVYGEAPPTASKVAEDRHALAGTLLRGFSSDRRLVSLSLAPPGFVTTVSARPRASRLARYRASQGQRVVVNLAHEQISLDPVSFALMPLLDGHHTRAELLEHLATVQREGALANSTPDAAKADIEADLLSSLAALAGHALLTG